MKITEKEYRLMEIEAESTDYNAAYAYAHELITKGYYADMVKAFKHDDKKTPVYLITASKKIPLDKTQ